MLVQVFQVQRDALFNKSERQAAEAQLATVQKQMSDLQAQSSHVQELHNNIQESQGQVKEKDRKVGGGLERGGGGGEVRKGRTGGRKQPRLNSINEELSLLVQITDLSKEVFRLKEALGALSPPLGISSSSSSSSPSNLSPAHHNNPGQQVALQNRLAIVTQQLQVTDEEHVWR